MLYMRKDAASQATGGWAYALFGPDRQQIDATAQADYIYSTLFDWLAPRARSAASRGRRAASARFLDRRTRHIAIGAEHVAITPQWLHEHATALALIKVWQASVGIVSSLACAHSRQINVDVALVVIPMGLDRYRCDWSVIFIYRRQHTPCGSYWFNPRLNHGCVIG